MQQLLRHATTLTRPCRTSRVTICIPAHNEAASISHLVAAIDRDVVAPGFADEIVVVDDRSTDRTASLARDAGARVVSSDAHLRDFGSSLGKGDALWRGASVIDSDVIVWCDGDVSGFDVTALTRLATPLLNDPDLHLVKGYFRRRGSDGTVQHGRVTELAARPTLRLLFPDLADIVEPIGGLIGIRTSSLRELWLEPDYGVDLGVLIDVSRRWGRRAIAQADLGELSHRSRPLGELGSSALAVHRVAFDRVGIEPPCRVPKRPPLAWVRPALASAVG